MGSGMPGARIGPPWRFRCAGEGFGSVLRPVGSCGEVYRQRMSRGIVRRITFLQLKARLKVFEGGTI
jgi:hypothetical protein